MELLENSRTMVPADEETFSAGDGTHPPRHHLCEKWIHLCLLSGFHIIIMIALVTSEYHEHVLLGRVCSQQFLCADSQKWITVETNSKGGEVDR